MQLYQKAFSRDAWPSVAFTADEGRALHAVTNAVNIYDPASFSTGALPLPPVSVHNASTLQLASGRQTWRRNASRRLLPAIAGCKHQRWK